MTDKELLELAAKAAGIKDEMWLWDWWNPLTDDGDALRLAVKLVMDIEFIWDDVPETTAIACVRVTEIGGGGWAIEELGFDPYAATRRAVVRCAAEIGKGMP